MASVFLCLSMSVPFMIGPFVCISMPISLCLFLFSVFLSVSPCLSLLDCLYLSISPFMPLATCVCLYTFLSAFVCLCFELFAVSPFLSLNQRVIVFHILFVIMSLIYVATLQYYIRIFDFQIFQNQHFLAPTIIKVLKHEILKI